MISLSLLILAAAGSPPPADFRTFHAELRAALERGDPTALAPLVSFPVRVNRPDGSATSIDNLRGLQRELDQAGLGRVCPSTCTRSVRVRARMGSAGTAAAATRRRRCRSRRPDRCARC